MALTPEAVTKLIASGFELAVERGAGTTARFTDEAYLEAGAELVAPEAAADCAGIVRVGRPEPAEVERLAAGTVLIGFLQPLSDAEGVERLRAQGVVAFAMESIPRTTRAQSMDALSSQATIAGYKAVLLAADRSPKLFPLLMTAAGTIAPGARARARAPASPGCRRSRPRGGSAPSSRPSTCGRP